MCDKNIFGTRMAAEFVLANGKKIQMKKTGLCARMLEKDLAISNSI